MKDMKLSPEDHRFIERMIKIGIQNGLNLETNVQDSIKVKFCVHHVYVFSVN